MSTYVIGFKPPDDKWKRMKAVWDACFDNQEGGLCPSEHGVQISEEALKKCGALVEFSNDDEEGKELHVDKLPKDVKVIRFLNSW